MILGAATIFTGASAAQASDGLQIVSSSPALQSLDNVARSEISPDGDHINDRVIYTVQTQAYSSVQLMVSFWLIGQHHVATVGPVVADPQGRAVIAWDGRDENGNVVQDGGYNLTLCHTDKQDSSISSPLLPPGPLASPGLQCGCTLTQPGITAASIACNGHSDAVVHKRIMSVTLPGAVVRSVRRGSSTDLEIDSDRTDNFKVKLTSNDGVTLYQDYGVRKAGIAPILVPDWLGPGQYRVIVKNAAGAERSVPIVVRAQVSIEQFLQRRKGASEILPHTVLVVSPSLTWRAYNYADSNMDGFPETWYAFQGQEGGGSKVSLPAAYEHQGETGVDGYERGYWQVRDVHPGWRVEAITDYEMGLLPQNVLNAYAAVVFPGHTEYYTQEMLDHLRDFRASGGHIAFWGANNIFAEVSVNEQLGYEQLENRPMYTPNSLRRDFKLIGNGYVFCCFGDAQFSYEVTRQGLRNFPWLYKGTGLIAGDKFGHLGNEIDTTIERLSARPRQEIAGMTLDYFDPNFNKQVTPRVSMLWLPPHHNRQSAQGAVFSAGSRSFLTGVSANSDNLDQARVVRIVTNMQGELAYLEHLKVIPRGGTFSGM